MGGGGGGEGSCFPGLQSNILIDEQSTSKTVPVASTKDGHNDHNYGLY